MKKRNKNVGIASEYFVYVTKEKCSFSPRDVNQWVWYFLKRQSLEHENFGCRMFSFIGKEIVWVSLIPRSNDISRAI